MPTVELEHETGEGTAMTEPTESTAVVSNQDDWLAVPESDAIDSESGGPSAPAAPSRRTYAVRAGLVVVGAVVGGIVVGSVHHDSSATNVPTAFAGPQANGQVPNGQVPNGRLPNGRLPNGGQFAGGGQGGFGGLDGEQHLAGTLVSVGSGSVTVRTSSGTATYTVTGKTEIVRNGQQVSLSALKAGDPVFVHVYPAGSSSRLTVERLFAGSSATDAPGVGPVGRSGQT